MATIEFKHITAGHITKATITVPDSWEDLYIIDGRLSIDVPLSGPFRVEQLTREEDNVE